MHNKLYQRQVRQRDCLVARSFTLVELLIVTAVLLILVSLLQPSLTKAFHSARSIACKSKLSQIGVGAQVFANSHDDHLPLSGDWDNDWNVTPVKARDADRKKYSWYRSGNDFRPVPFFSALAIEMGAKIRTDSWTNLRDDVESSKVQVYTPFVCPASKKVELSVITCGSQMEYTDYAPNREITNYTPTTSENCPIGNVNRICYPSRVMLCGDAKQYNKTDRLYFLHNGKTSTLATYYKTNDIWAPTFDLIRHQGDMQVLFVDGHSETVSIDPDDLAKVGLNKGVYP